MSDVKHYEILNLNTRIQCKNRIAFKGDTVSSDEVLKPSILEGLCSVNKIKLVGSASAAPEKKEKPAKSKPEKVEVKEEAKKDAPEDEPKPRKSLFKKKKSKKKSPKPKAE